MKIAKNRKPLFVIEQLEPRLGDWAMLEYAHISQIVGKEHLLFTNTRSPRLAKLGKTDARKSAQLKLTKLCVLDPAAKKKLTTKDAKGFKAFLFGGILGDYPPRQRTTPAFINVVGERRNLGKEQMSTDTAVMVTKMVIEGTPRSKIRFQDAISIPLRAGEEIELPYRYVLDNAGKPILPSGLVKMLKKRRGF